MQPKMYSGPKIALLNIELELKAERDNAEIRLDSVEVSGGHGVGGVQAMGSNGRKSAVSRPCRDQD